jgi:hypothetical protein
MVGRQRPNRNNARTKQYLKQKAVVDSQKNESNRDLLLDLVTSDMNFVRLFVAVAKSAYDLGKLNASEFARSEAMKLYCEAFRTVRQMPEADRELFSSDLQNLYTQIRWLSVETNALHNPCPEMEDASMEALLKLLRAEG